MSKLWQGVAGFLLNEEGPTAVEYAVMAALIIAVCVAGIVAFGNTTNGVFTSDVNSITQSSGS